MKPARARRTAAVVVLAVLALAGCSTSQAGAAAVVGSQSVSDSDIATMVEAVRATVVSTPTTPFDESTATKANVNRLARHLLLTEAGKREGVTVTQSQIDDLISKTTNDNFAGDANKFKVALTTQYLVPPDEIPSFAGDVLMASALQAKLAPGADAATGQAALNTYLATLGKEIGVEISPRFGTWSFEKSTIGDLPNDISTTAPGAASASPSATPTTSAP